jgi:hypothetical protein
MATGLLYVRDLRFCDDGLQTKTAAVEEWQPVRDSRPVLDSQLV